MAGIKVQYEPCANTIPLNSKHTAQAPLVAKVQEILKEEKTLNQLATENGVHPNQLKRWKATALEGLPGLFSKSEQAVQTAAEHEHQVTELYAEIGRLTTELAWLKKKAGLVAQG